MQYDTVRSGYNILEGDPTHSRKFWYLFRRGLLKKRKWIGVSADILNILYICPNSVFQVCSSSFTCGIVDLRCTCTCTAIVCLESISRLA
jgi:hypothetical protein